MNGRVLTDFGNDEEKKGSIVGNVKYGGGPKKRHVVAACRVWDY